MSRRGAATGEPSGAGDSLEVRAICALGCEEFVASELEELGADGISRGRGVVACRGDWRLVQHANLWLRTANRVAVVLHEWPVRSDDDLYRGLVELLRSDRRWLGLGILELFDPALSIAFRASSRRSPLRDSRWISQRAKDAVVDAQRELFGRRASVSRSDPDVSFRIFIEGNRASLLLDTSGAPLDRRGYRRRTVEAPVREHLAAACVLASGWDGSGAVLDPMCGSGTMLVEAGWWARGWAPGRLRESWPLQRFSVGSRGEAEAKRGEGSAPLLYGRDRDAEAVRASRENLEAAGLADDARVRRADAFDVEAPEESGLLLLNPAYGERLELEPAQWRRIGDLLKQRFAGWTAVVLAGGEDRGRSIGLRPRRRHPVFNGPLEARILVFDLY